MRYHIAIPTRNREVLTISNLDLNRHRVTLFVNSKKERDRLDGKYEVVVTNTEGISAARNAILDHYGTGERVVMMDDDVKGVWKLVGGGGKLERLNGLEVRLLLTHGFDLCDTFSAKLWGVYPIKNHFFMGHDIHPAGFCISTFSGIVVSDMRFDENMPLKEDYDFTIQHVVADGRVIRMNSFCAEAIHYTNKGGCQDYRNDSREQEAVEYLIGKWPNFVRPNPKRKGEILLSFKVRRK